MVSDLDLGQASKNPTTLACEGCIQRKQQKASFPSGVATHTTKLLEIVYLNAYRPIKTVRYLNAHILLCITCLDSPPGEV